MAKELTLEEKLDAAQAELEAEKLESAALKLELEAVKTELTATKEVNASLSAEIETLSATPSIAGDSKAGLSFEYDGKKYGFNFHQMNHKGKDITSEDVVANPALQKELVGMQSGMIK